VLSNLVVNADRVIPGREGDVDELRDQFFEIGLHGVGFEEAETELQKLGSVAVAAAQNDCQANSVTFQITQNVFV
jgi:hypothetical protein